MIDVISDVCEKHKTNYDIRKEGALYSVYDGEKMACKGFFDEESALHAIWVQNGKREDCYYAVEEGVVYCYIKMQAYA